MGAVFAPTRFSLVRISIRDLAADGKSSVRNSGVGGGGENFDPQSKLQKNGFPAENKKHIPTEKIGPIKSPAVPAIKKKTVASGCRLLVQKCLFLQNGGAHMSQTPIFIVSFDTC